MLKSLGGTVAEPTRRVVLKHWVVPVVPTGRKLKLLSYLQSVRLRYKKFHPFVEY